MTLIRFRIFLMNAISGVMIIVFGWLTALSYQQQQKLIHDLQTSRILIDQVRSLGDRKLNPELIALINNKSLDLEPVSRKESLGRLVAAYKNKNYRELKVQSETFIKNEQEYHRYIDPQISYLQQRVLYTALICVAAMIFSVLGTWIYLNSAIFSPIQSLSRRMQEFLQHRYTYYFTQPAPNEIGNLQSTFNSLAQRVLQNMEDLTALDRAKSEFLSIASHELRTPLTSIKGSLSLMRGGIVGTMNEAAVHLMTIAETETDRLIRLINDILDLAKIEAQKFPLHPHWQSFRPLIDTNIESLQGLAKTAGVRLTGNCQMSVEVFMDKDRIQQVMTNLISNAIKFSPQDAHVEVVGFINSDRHFQIEIRDQGRGIAPHDQQLIFQKFRQATSPENPLVKGTGLGLAIAKALVEEHRGTIGVRSTVGQGSTFYFTLPQWRLTLDKADPVVRSAG